MILSYTPTNRPVASTMTPDQQTIAYIAFGIAALCILIRFLRPSSNRTAKYIKGNLNMGDTQGNVTQNYTAPDQTPAKKERDWFDITMLIIAIITHVSGIVLSVLTYLNGTP